MRLHRLEGSCALAFLIFLIHSVTAVERHYYIAAVNINWDYSSNGNPRADSLYRKTVFREYHPGFKQAKTHPSWSGLLGPTIRGQEGDTIVVTFKNMADHPCSIHPHGISYGKQSEGSLYFDNTSEFEKEDDVIHPGSEHTYNWEVTPDMTPKAADPPCVTYTYLSHYDFVKDFNTGLIGPLLICKEGSLDDSGNQVYFDQELTLLFGVFDESNSWYSTGAHSPKENVKYTINGFTNGNVPDLSVCAYSKITWHLLGMSSEPELFSVHFNGHVLQQSGHKVSSVGIISGTASSAEMVPFNTGRWLFSSHISKHLDAGMHGFLTVNACEKFSAPKRKITIQQSRESQEWTYYIAAEEIIWDYAPNMPENVDGDFRSTYLKQSAERIGKKYKKAVFTQYKDETFKERAELKQRKKEVGILGPVIRAQIRDVIKIVFKNKATRPYSIYPHGLTIDKTTEGVNYPEGGNQTHAVQPGETYTYVWRVIEDDEPLHNDSRCLTRMYHSAVNTPRDIASGLVGPLLICKSQSLNTRNVQLRSDKEQHAMFAVFDENRSWYMDENIDMFCGDPKRVKKEDPEFYKSNVMHTINGYVYESGQVLGFCNGEIVTWHVSSVGGQDGIQTATFYGHTFELNNREEDILSLFPMTGETISMNMANDGIWLLASLNTHETTKGLRLKFKDVECFRDFVSEDYYDGEEDKDDASPAFSIWKPVEEKDIKKVPVATKKPVIDEDTELYADILGLRTFSDSGNKTSDMDEVDLSFLDHDDGPFEYSSASITDETQNSTSPELDSSDALLAEVIGFDDSNLTSGSVQKETATSFSEVHTILPNDSIISDPRIVSTNSSNITVVSDDRNITSKYSQNASVIAKETMPLPSNQTSESQEEIEIEERTVDFSVEVEEGDDRSSNIFIYSVPDRKSPTTITEIQELENFVLLDGGDQVEINGDKSIVEYKISPAEIPNNSTVELQRNITQNITNEDIQELTKESSKLSNETSQTESELPIEEAQALNSTKVDLQFSLDIIQEINITQLENVEAQDVNSTKVVSEFPLEEFDDLEFPLKEFQELNATQLDSEFSDEGAHVLNSTQVDLNTLDYVQELNTTQLYSDLSGEGAQVLNSTQVDLDLQDYVQELNTTQLDSDLSVEGGQVLNSTQVDLDPLDYVQELNTTQLGSYLSVEGAQILNRTQVDLDLQDYVQELNTTQLDSDLSVEGGQILNSTQVDLDLQDYVQELNTTQMENEDAQEINNTKVVSEFPSEEFQELNMTQFEIEFPNEEAQEFPNVTLPNGTLSVNESRKSTNSSQNATSSDLFFTSYAHNETRLQVSKLWNSSEEFSLESREKISSNTTFNISSPEIFSNGTGASSSDIGINKDGYFVSEVPEQDSSSEEVVPVAEESREEVVIYVMNSNNSEVILTSSLDPQGENWSYESKHDSVPMEISDHIQKYITDEPVVQPNTSSNKKEEKRMVLKRVTPMKGYGIKTKKRKEYKPQPRSAITSRGFSPRGFAPTGLSPMGTRPISSEEDLHAKSIVIGVPRRDFNDYELYVPKQDQDYDFDSVSKHPDEYEFIEYKDPYTKQVDIQSVVVDEANKYSLPMSGGKARTYFITAEEVVWDYAGYGQRREDKVLQKERPTQFKKVMFREYLDSYFTIPYIRGEVDEHLGILGPIIKAEVDETIYIVFRNLASRPYSLHANGVSYGKNMEGLKYEDESPYWYRQDDAVQPNTTFVYMWKVNAKIGPLQSESDCRIWAYYSGVNPERDIHSGLIGPLMVCRKDTLDKNPVDTRDFMLLFMTFDENKSWYYEKNREVLERTARKAVLDPEFNSNIQFHAINGIIYSLKGLRMYTNQLVKWHLINMGSPKDFHSIHFHGQTFLNKHTQDHRQGVFPLLPGGFATLEMWPTKPGLWLLESELGISQQRGMQTLFLVIDNVCEHPLGLISGTVKDSQITASNNRGNWLPSLARLHNSGQFNAWSTENVGDWIQVDFQRPVVISKVATQGAKQFVTHHFVQNYTISYSTDRKKWIFYKGDSKAFRKTFEGNTEAHEVKENIFFPPIVSRFVRLHPSHSYNFPTIRMEFYGCQLDGCSVPLGMQSGHITDKQITASSIATNWRLASWQPFFARLDKQGAINAWQAKSNDMQPWLQIELKMAKKITGIVTQGAKTFVTEMFVTAYVLEYSDDGKRWTKYTEDEDYEQKTFIGNSDNNGHVKNYIYPPIFSKFIRIIPRAWQNSVTMRVELLGCDFE